MRFFNFLLIILSSGLRCVSLLRFRLPESSRRFSVDIRQVSGVADMTLGARETVCETDDTLGIEVSMIVFRTAADIFTTYSSFQI